MDNMAEEVHKLVSAKDDLLRIVADNPSTQAELSESLDVTVPTISRNLTDMENIGLIKRRDGRYYLTEFGEEVLTNYENYMKEIDRVCRIEEAISTFGNDITYDSPIITDGEVIFSERRAPDAGLYSIKEKVQNAVEVHAVFDSILTNYFDIYFHDSTRTKEEISYIFPESMIDTIRRNYGHILENLFDSKNFELSITSEPVNFSITVTELEQGEKQAWIIAHNATGVQTLIRNDSPSAIEWAESRIQTYAKSSRSFDRDAISAD